MTARFTIRSVINRASQGRLLTRQCKLSSIDEDVKDEADRKSEVETIPSAGADPERYTLGPTCLPAHSGQRMSS